ncbi:MAG TPA: DUF3095 domain-containing protein [Phycisphaerales bacterium]|nr:DUF3095 domain-containing protein [Phycisphaerales bacterium]
MNTSELQDVVHETAGDIKTPKAGESDRFFADLPTLTNFADVAKTESYRELPTDWCVGVADVAGSTAAIAEGRYRDINLIGASAIVAVLNATQPRDLPFVFGGDGATVCFPENCAKDAWKALRGTQRMAKSQFGLTLRCGIVSGREIADAGRRVLVAKVHVSESYKQAAFAGGGILWAEQKVKETERADDPSEHVEADFSGLECRWNPIVRKGNEFVSLLVKAEGDLPHRERVYQDVIAKIAGIYGTDVHGKPVTEQSLRLMLRPAGLLKEVKVQQGNRGQLVKTLKALYIWLETAAGAVFIKFGIRAVGVNWKDYRKELIANTDSRKFDDLLREVRSGTEFQTRQLREFLESRMTAGDLIYGMHVAQSALMTCLIFERGGNHVHFVDGADGGYAMAASELKKRMAIRKG